MNWLFRRIERFYAHIRLFRLDVKRDQLLAQLTCTPDGPLKRPLLQSLEVIDQEMAGVRTEVAQKMQERDAARRGFEPWAFEVPTEGDKTVPRSKIRIED